MSECLFRPGMRYGPYPQKQESGLTEFEHSAALFFNRFRNLLVRRRLNQDYIVNKVNYYAEPLFGCSEETLTIAILELQEKLARHGLTETLIAQAFAVIRETAARTLGKRHYDVQLFGGWIMINGMLAEMETGEGKTLATALAACTAAMAGIPVHVITANDYLAARDAEIMQPLYRRLGLTAAAVTDGMDKEQRRKNYQGNIVHTTNKQIAFDYLRDRIEMGHDTGPLRFQFRQIHHEIRHENDHRLLLRGLCFALIDEADSVLIDEAKTPLIITKTKPNEENPETYGDALYLASSLTRYEDFLADAKTREINLTPQGEEKLEKMILLLPQLWRNKRKREFLVKLAITAELFYKKDIHYIVAEDKVQIVDEFTGRVMADRSWEQGLHQIIEAREGCIITEARETIARISYQNFFRRYLRLAGTSGTLKEVAHELQHVYGLQTVKVQTHFPSKRILMPERLYSTPEYAKIAFLERMSGLYACNRPVLIGTNSVAESGLVSKWLMQAGYPHRVLNAAQDKEEADIIAKAGWQGAITVATNMAGRGTDIALGLGVKELGGLHVIALNSNDSRRIDRQLFGRCGRQGDPGSVEQILSFYDPSLQHFYSPAMLRIFGKVCSGSKPVPAVLAKLILRFPQFMRERKLRIIRGQVMQHDRHLAKLMAFTGKFE